MFNASFGFTFFENTGTRQLKSGVNYDETMKFKSIPKSFIRLTYSRAKYFDHAPSNQSIYSCLFLRNKQMTAFNIKRQVNYFPLIGSNSSFAG
jgi:hypothetical protein